jgi:hypothetical protein
MMTVPELTRLKAVLVFLVVVIGIILCVLAATAHNYLAIMGIVVVGCIVSFVICQCLQDCLTEE